MATLFESTAPPNQPRIIGLPGGLASVSYWAKAVEEAEEDFKRLEDLPDWEQHSIVLFGKELPEPRLTAYYGDEGAAYTYSKKQREPVPMPNVVQALRLTAERLCGQPFNSALLNFYRDGQDSMGWHSDKEAELGPDPSVASFSFGAERWFSLRLNPKENPSSEKPIKLLLEHGSLLLMGPDVQKHYQHALPKTAKGQTTGPRINVTFRHVVL